MKLYLKIWNPNGQVLGIKNSKGKVEHIGRFYSDRPTDVKDVAALVLMERYPNHVGEYEKDRKKIEARARKMKAKMAGEKHGRLRSEGPARQPTEKRVKNAERRENAEAVDEKISNGNDWDSNDDSFPENFGLPKEISDDEEDAPNFQEPHDKPVVSRKRAAKKKATRKKRK